MDSLFNLLKQMDKTSICLILIAITLVISFIYTFVVSRKLTASKSFFITSVIMPVIVASVISVVSIFLDGTTSGAVRIVTIAVALGLIRFRSAQGSAEEIAVLFGGVAIGLISGLGYVVIALIVSILIAILYVFISKSKLFDSTKHYKDKLLKITIPEDLNYENEFNSILNKYLKSYKLLEIKTTSMGSLFKLSYKVELLNDSDSKALIDELRIKNSNLEISIVPFIENNTTL